MATRRAALLGMSALLGGCGFRPLLKPSADATGVRDQLVAVEVPQMTGRIGYLVRDSLLDQLNPTGVEVPSRYRLDVQLRRRSAALGIQLDNTVTRYNLTLDARYNLVDLGTGKTVHRELVRRVASYNAVRAIYSEFAAEQDAERRAAREVGIDIRTQLAIYFARQAEAAEKAPPTEGEAPS